MDWLVIRVVDRCYRVLRIVVHYLLALAYWSRDRKVPPVGDPILQMSATELAEQIREGELSSESVVRAFVDRILEVEPYVNATVECRFGEALREAREADILVSSGTLTKQQLMKEKPLLGVPFSVKCLLTVKGLRSTAGSLLFQDVRAQEDAKSVALMKGAGGIVIATTNSSEMGMNFETNNYAHGTTCNPYSTARTSGGSSGGESALLAAAGSVIGLGNDLAGSIRVPCMFTGLFGHKPSRGLVPNGGCFPTPSIKTQRLLNTGPMCRYARDMETTMRVLASQNEKPIQFGKEVDFRSLKIYYLYSFGNMRLVEKVDPDMRDAVKKVVSYFETKHGSITQEVNIPLLRQSNKIFVHALCSSVENIVDTLTAGKAKVDPTQELFKMLFRQSIFTVGPVVAMNFNSIPMLFNHDKVEHYKKLTEELEDKFDKLLDDRSILVMPTLPFPAPYHNEMPLLTGSCCYTHIFNVLGLPSTQCPVKQTKRGLPVGVQVIGRLGNDALTISCAIELEKAFGGWIPPK